MCKYEGRPPCPRPPSPPFLDFANGGKMKIPETLASLRQLDKIAAALWFYRSNKNSPLAISAKQYLLLTP